jgi:hypothetical protein
MTVIALLLYIHPVEWHTVTIITVLSNRSQMARRKWVINDTLYSYTDLEGGRNLSDTTFYLESRVIFRQIIRLTEVVRVGRGLVFEVGTHLKMPNRLEVREYSSHGTSNSCYSFSV